MPVVEHLEGQWREWRHARVAELTRPYGWTSLVAQHWLEEGAAVRELDLLPGTWSVENGAVIFTPPAHGPTLSVDGEHQRTPIEIVRGRNQSFGHGKSVAVYYGACEVETIDRTTDSGSAIFAVRVRDPRVSAMKDFSGLSAFDYNPDWRVPVTFTPAPRDDVQAVTVEPGVRETTTWIGTLRFEHGGSEHDLTIIGKESAEGVTPVAHVRDLTSGKETYGAGRVVNLEWADDAHQRIDFVDFNYLVALPCAFTNFVTCPLAPRENHLDFAIEAGEKRPRQDVDRVTTFRA